MISFYNTLTYDDKRVHPEIAQGHCIISRVSTIHWVDFPKPPKKDAALWRSIVETQIQLLIEEITITWHIPASPIHRTIFMLLTMNNYLYQHTNTGYKQYQLKQTR